MGNTVEVKELIYLETDEFTLIIKGPPVHPDLEKLYPDYESAEARLEINPVNSDLQDCFHFSPQEDKLVAYTTSQVFPFFYEHQDYEVVIESHTDQELEFYHSSQRIREAVQPISKKQNILTGTINFRSDVGLAEFKVKREGFTLLEVIIEVFPSRIDYKTDYQKLLREVNQEVYNLAYDFLRRTCQEMNLKEADNVSHSEFFTILEQIVADFKQAFNRIRQKPHHQLKSRSRVKPAGKVKQVNCKSIKWLRKNLQFYDREQERPVKMLDVEKRTSFDTFENRFVKWMIIKIKSRLLTFKEEYQRTVYGTPEPEVIAQIDKLRSELDFMLERTFLSEVGRLQKTNSLSLVLQMASGYRELYKYYLMLQKGLSINGELFNLSIKQTWELYEYWCFLKLNQILRNKYKLIKNELIAIDYSGIYVTLNKSNTSRVEYQHPETGEKFSLVYNAASGAGVTTGQKPDNVLSLEKEDSELQYKFIFDAKYRINPAYEGSSYNNKYGLPGPEEDTINTMHRYRDAVVQENQTQFKRTIVGAYILFPYHNQEEFKDHHFYQSIDKVNVGAFPFLPGSVDLVAEFLEQLVEETSLSSFERHVLPKGEQEYQAKLDFKRNVLVGSLRSRKQLEIMREEEFYYLPAEGIDLSEQVLEYVALYQSKRKFPSSYGVNYYGRIRNCQLVERSEIPVPLNRDNGEQLYYLLTVDGWQKLASPIVPEGYGIRGSHIYTNYMLLQRAETLPELSIKTLAEWRVWLELKRIQEELEVVVPKGGVGSNTKIKGFQGAGVKLEVTAEKIKLKTERKTRTTDISKFLKQPRQVINEIFD